MSAILSVCVPSYSRRDLVCSLVESFLKSEHEIEVIVHLDGDVDSSMDALRRFEDERLKVSISENRGRASALSQALDIATGKYVMIYDDDDTIDLGGLETIINDCSADLPKGVCGFIYHMADLKGERLGSAFKSVRSNLLKLRADEGVKGDKKEVILNEVINKCSVFETNKYRRVPTSLLWARVALAFDVICRNEIVGVKNYHAGGMTDGIRQLKRRDPRPMFETHRLRFYGILRGRYKSWRFAARSAVGIIMYGALTIKPKWLNK